MQFLHMTALPYALPLRVARAASLFIVEGRNDVALAYVYFEDLNDAYSRS